MPKCDKDCNTPKVLEIHNHECPVLFHRVVVPAAIGDDETNPPRNGQYRNVLLVYEANGHVYLFSSDGIPTFISDGGQGVDDYNELENKPSINGHELIGDSSLEDIGVDDAIADALEDYTPTSDLAEVALSGDYNDLSNTPAIPTVNDATLTITRNNVSAGTFTANSATDTSINIAVPTATSDLTNDSGFITNAVNNLVNYYTKTETDTAIGVETSNRENADQGLQEQIDALASASDVVDVVGTYAELQAYDTSHLNNNDIIKVLTDETHDNAISYYRWNTATSSFSYIGSQGPFYTKAESDATFVPQTRTVNNKALSTNITLTAADVGALPDSTVIPTVNDATLTIQKNGATVTTFTANSATNATANITVPTKTSDLTNDGADNTSTYVESDDLATVATTGSYNDLSDKPDIMTGLTEMSYGESNAWAKFLAAYQAKQIVYCRASSNTSPGTGSQTRKAFMAYVDNAETPTYVEFQYVRSVGTKTAAQPVDQVFVYALDRRNGGTWAVQTRDMAPKLAQGTNTTVSYSNGTYTISATQPTVPTKTSDLTNDGSDGTSTYVEANELATVATTGDYDDLTNKPTIPTVNNATLTIQRNGTTVDTFTANSAQDKTVNIVVPTATSDLTNDSGFLTSIPTASSSVLGGVKVGAGLSITDGVLSVTGGGVADAVEWANVLNKPTNVSYWANDAGYITSAALPTKTSDLTNDGSDGSSTYVEADELSTVATSGSYNDLTNKPTMPTVNDATLTIQRNGVNIDSFTANASQNKSINVVVPTKTSDLTNDSNFATTSQIPTKTSDLANDGSDGTAAYLETDETAYKTASIPYGQCDATSTATVFTATVPGVTELRDGVCMWLKNGVVTSAANFTININNLGAKPVYSNMAAATRDTTIWNVNYTMLFVYDSTRVAGGCWVLYRGYNSDNNTIGYQVRTNSQSLPMSSVVYRYRLLFTSADNNHYVPANNSTSTNATSRRTVCQDKINPFGSIFYYNATASAAANTRPSATALWQQYAIALGYSFNNTGAALTLTSWKPVYVKAAPQSDGSAIIDSTTPYVQDLPTTEDGKIYIFLGVAYSATNIELQLDHPVYWYKDGMIRPYTNAAAGISSVAWGDITGTLSSQTDLNTALGAKANSADLATVATSGSYNDLSNKPTIPTVNNATLTIQKNGTTVNTFTANASSNVTANISVPTATSDLTNDSGFITSITKITNAEIDAIMGVA